MRMDLDTWEEILVTITRNKTRSLLTAFGVFWGIFMLISLMGGSGGLKALMSDNFKGFATNSAFVWPQSTGEAYKGFRKGRWWSLELNDVDLLKRKVPELDVLTPFMGRWGLTAVYGEQTSSTMLKGLFPDYAKVEEQDISIGRYINEVDIREKRKVCVIGKRVYEELFGADTDPSGKFVRVDGVYYQVVGVSVSESNMSIGGRASESIVIPFSTMQQVYNKGVEIDLLALTVLPGYKVTDIQDKVSAILKEAHSIHPDDKQAVMVMNAEAMFSMVDNLFKGIHVLSVMVGLGTLLAGAIGVSNIMMVTVKERTTEFGIRRAIGARPRDILQQVLAESIVLTAIAGVAGISFAVFLLQMAEMGINATRTSPAPFQVDFWTALSMASLLLVLGLLAGLAPAYRAMSVKPIDAMREE